MIKTKNGVSLASLIEDAIDGYKNGDYGSTAAILWSLHKIAVRLDRLANTIPTEEDRKN